MTVDSVNVRLSEIEQTWQAASASERLVYLDELTEMAGTLELVTGPNAEDAQWLTRRLHRVIRHINQDPDSADLSPKVSRCSATTSKALQLRDGDAFTGE